MFVNVLVKFVKLFSKYTLMQGFSVGISYLGYTNLLFVIESETLGGFDLSPAVPLHEQVVRVGPLGERLHLSDILWQRNHWTP